MTLFQRVTAFFLGAFALFIGAQVFMGFVQGHIVVRCADDSYPQVTMNKNDTTRWYHCAEGISVKGYESFFYQDGGKTECPDTLERKGRSLACVGK